MRALPLFLLLLLSLPAFAQPLPMIFVYPDGEGSAEDAQPVLDQFAAEVKSLGGPELAGRYVRSLEEGLALIRQGRAKIGILSTDAYLHYQSQVPLQILLTAVPARAKGGKERYYVLGPKGGQAAGALPLVASRPLNEAYLSRVVLKGFTAAPGRETAENLLPVLKKIAAGEKKAAVLLGSYEYASITNLKLEWVKSLELLHESGEIPASPLVAFGEVAPEKQAALTRALAGMAQTEAGREALETLRIRAFDKPDLEAYRALAETFSKAALAAPKIPASSPN